MYLRIRRSQAANRRRAYIRRAPPANTRYRFYLCRSERVGTRVVRRDIAYAGSITDKDMATLANVARVYRDMDAALDKVGATEEDRTAILAGMARWCPRPDAAAVQAEIDRRNAEYADFYRRYEAAHRRAATPMPAAG